MLKAGVSGKSVLSLPTYMRDNLAMKALTLVSSLLSFAAIIVAISLLVYYQSYDGACELSFTLAHGKVLYSDSIGDQKAPPGSKATVECKEGYYTETIESATCYNGQWDKTEFTDCKRACGDIEQSRNGACSKKLHTALDRQTIVRLFEWKWVDIANECEVFLAQYGYGAVLVSPPNEHLIVMDNNGDIPWWVRYQPVSYKLISRGGNEAEFIDMVRRCNAVGVRILVDTVINHMVSLGQKYGVDGKSSSAGSTFDGTSGSESFPAVLYGPGDFSPCKNDIQDSDYTKNAVAVRNCRLGGLLDLNQGVAHVQTKIVEYLNRLIDIGVVGFRIDAAKHMWPSDLRKILSQLKELRSDVFSAGHHAFIMLEIIDYGHELIKTADYSDIGRATDYMFSSKVTEKAFHDGIQTLKEIGGKDWPLKTGDAVAFVDNHDTQRGGQGAMYEEPKKHKMVVGFMLAWDYGIPLVMSGYSFSKHGQGPPRNALFNTTSPTFHDNGTCTEGNGWVCEHRWPSVRNMALFRSVSAGAPVTKIRTDLNQLAFAREGKGYFAMNNDEERSWQLTTETTLPQGTYCDVFNGELSASGLCTGERITVDLDGIAMLHVPTDSALAFHLGSKIDNDRFQISSTEANNVSVVVPVGPARTVVFLYKKTDFGQDLFIRGGIDNNHRDNCVSDAAVDPCSIDIKHELRPNSPITYREWSANDDHLDWYGAEKNQGKYSGGIIAKGSPLAWTTDHADGTSYDLYNSFGAQYWMMVVQMNCSQTVEGWFELKGFQTSDNGELWEPAVQQGYCTGSIGGKRPYKTENHFARCGYLNVFKWASSSCLINTID